MWYSWCYICQYQDGLIMGCEIKKPLPVKVSKQRG